MVQYYQWRNAMTNLLIFFYVLDYSGNTTQFYILHQWFYYKKLKLFTTNQPTDFFRNDKGI